MVLEKCFKLLEFVYVCDPIIGKFEILQFFVKTAYNDLFIYLPARDFTSRPPSSGICVK